MLKPRPPIRAFAVVAVLAVLGAVLFVAADLVSWGLVLFIAAIVVWVFAGLLVLAIIGAIARNRVRVEIDDQGYTVYGPQGKRSGVWDDVVRVTQSSTGRRVTIHRRNNSVVHLVGRNEGVELARVKSSIVQHLDGHRGYGLSGEHH